MSLNDTPSADRVHIGFYGVRNAGKSSLVNALTGQEMSVVSPVAGTTTDPVRKAMELLPIGPVVILDTPGLDDEGDLGEKRVRRTAEMLNRTDLAVLVRSDPDGYLPDEQAWAEKLAQREIPYLERGDRLRDPYAEGGAGAPVRRSREKRKKDPDRPADARGYGGPGHAHRRVGAEGAAHPPAGGDAAGTAGRALYGRRLPAG